jgi:hypothetical protein
MNSTIKTAAKITEELSQLNEKSDAKRDGIQHTRARLGESLKTKWKNKVMHGQYIRSLDRQLISGVDMFHWLSEGDLKTETGSEIVAAQDQALQTEYYATKILNTGTDSKCRLCQQFYETIEHIISACPILANEQYIKRHDRVCAQLHFNICKETGKIGQKTLVSACTIISRNKPRSKVTTLWNQQVQTDRTIPNNKPYIIICDNEKRTCMLIDLAIAGDRNVIKKEAKKILKYNDLTIEIQRLWKVKTYWIPVIIGATVTISKSFRKYLSNKVKELQKTAILDTAHILRKVLM